MIKTKSIYRPIEKEDGYRVLISRLHPRGVKKSKYDAWFKDISPSLDLVHEYKNNSITLKKFFSKFKKEIEKNPDSLEILKDLRKKAKIKNVTLLCFEPDNNPCHRHVIREVLKKPKLLKESFIPKFCDN